MNQLESYFVSKQKKHGKHTFRFVPLNFTYTEIEALTKALMYENYVKARITAENISLTEAIEKELSRYPYTGKKLFEVGVLFSKGASIKYLRTEEEFDK